MEKSRSATYIAKSGGACSRRNKGVHGVPTRCWCGERIATFVSKTNKNPFRKFYRCEMAMQRKGEDHLFKWVDEALAEEISLVEARQRTIEEDLEDTRKTEKSEEDVALQKNGCLAVITWLCCNMALLYCLSMCCLSLCCFWYSEHLKCQV